MLTYTAILPIQVYLELTFNKCAKLDSHVYVSLSIWMSSWPYKLAKRSSLSTEMIFCFSERSDDSIGDLSLSSLVYLVRLNIYFFSTTHYFGDNIPVISLKTDNVNSLCFDQVSFAMLSFDSNINYSLIIWTKLTIEGLTEILLSIGMKLEIRKILTILNFLRYEYELFFQLLRSFLII